MRRLHSPFVKAKMKHNHTSKVQSFDDDAEDDDEECCSTELLGEGRSKSFTATTFTKSKKYGEKKLIFATVSASPAMYSPSLSSRNSLKKHTKPGLLQALKKFQSFDHASHSQSEQSTSNDGVKLTSHQGELIREAWHSANKKKGNAGVWIFKWLFGNYPFLKENFHLDTVPDDKLEQNERFQTHARIFSDVLEMVVDSVDALDDSVGPLLISYGSKHVEFEQCHPFKPEYWNYFTRAMSEYAAQSWKHFLHINDETLYSWKILVFFVVTKIREGFYFEKQRLAEVEMVEKLKIAKT